ncbi:MAG: DUF3782 domain-containing protein [Nitrospirota bacterium]
MAKDRFDSVRQILDEVDHRLNNVAMEHELFAGEMRQLRTAQEETGKQIKETFEGIKSSQKKTDEEIEKMAKEVGKVTGGLGRVAEGLAAPCVPEVFRELGIEVTSVQQRVKALKNRQVTAEIDLLCPARRNGSSLILVGEVKAHLTSEWVKYFLEDLPFFKENFPEYKEMEVIGLVAGLNIDDDAAKFAKRKGLYVLAATGETMQITNPSDFKPKVW